MSTLVQPRTRKAILPSFSHIARSAMFALLKIVAGILVTITALPVLLLFFVSAVPVVISIGLAAADVGLLLALIWLERTPVLVAGVIAGIIAVSLFAIVASQFFAYTPPITDARGKVIPGSIATMEKVNLNGSEQWITIRGKDVNKPVLLFLAGGPGGSELPFVRNVLGGLEDHFVVVNWDQPGAGKSYGAVPGSQLTIGRFVEDAHALTRLLRARFHQDKIYVFGESWGTVLGIKLVQQYPELFYAYVGAGQRTSVAEDDVMGYRFALEVAAERGDAKLVEKLQRNGPPPYAGWDMAFKNLDYLNVLNSYARAHVKPENTGHDLAGDSLTGVEYGLADRFNWWRGLLEGFTIVYPQMEDVDFSTQAARLQVPVYFLQGRYDLVEMGSLLERWYNVLQAPHKEIVYFENSGHTPHSYEPSKVVEVIVNHVLPQTYPASVDSSK